MAPSSAKSPDALQQKLIEYSGGGGTDCGRLDVHAAETQLKTASDCAMQAAQGKHAFYVAYDMPGMCVGVAGTSDGKLFTAQAQGSGPSAAPTSGACPSQLRVAASGRISCFAPGDMTSMGDSHAGGAMPAGMANPHGGLPPVLKARSRREQIWLRDLLCESDGAVPVMLWRWH
jgi:hypothetical protein